MGQYGLMGRLRIHSVKPSSFLVLARVGHERYACESWNMEGTQKSCLRWKCGHRLGHWVALYPVCPSWLTLLVWGWSWGCFCWGFCSFSGCWARLLGRPLAKSSPTSHLHHPCWRLGFDESMQWVPEHPFRS